MACGPPDDLASQLDLKKGNVTANLRLVAGHAIPHFPILTIQRQLGYKSCVPPK